MFDLLELMLKPRQDQALRIATVTPEGRTIVDTEKLFQLSKVRRVMDHLASRHVAGVQQVVITDKK
jgi:hypothetical protein